MSPGSARGEACSVHRHLFTLPGRTFLVPGVNPPLLYRPPCSQATESTRVRDDSAVTGRWACDLHTPSRHFFLFSYRSTGYSSASVAHPRCVSLHVCVLHCPCTASTQIMRTTSSPGCLRHDCCDAAWPTELARPSEAPRSVPRGSHSASGRRLGRQPAALLATERVFCSRYRASPARDQEGLLGGALSVA